MEHLAPFILQHPCETRRVRLMKTSVQTLLQSKLLELRKRNPQYSTRAFAKKLGVSSGALSEILNGMRSVSRKLATRFCERLLLDPMERASLMKSFPETRLKKFNSEESLHYLRVSTDQFTVMSEWYYFAILTLMKTADFKSNVDYVTERLGLTRNQVSQAIERMIRLQVISVGKDGTWTRSQQGHRTSDDLTDLSIQKNHMDTLELAKNALDKHSVDERDFTSLTLPLDPENLHEAKQMVRKFQNELYERFNHGKKPREVYRLAVQLFPLTQNSTQKRKTK